MDAALHDAGAIDAQVVDAGALTDSEISAVMIAINTGNIQRSQQAILHAKHSAVISFANLVLFDHGALNTALQGVMQLLSITAVGNALSDQITAATTRQVNRLKHERGDAFDLDYMQVQVATHRETIDLIDMQLLPQVHAQELRNQLKSMRSTEKTHLSNARDILDALEGDAGAEDGGT
jgi:predicted outer membrane protein